MKKIIQMTCVMAGAAIGGIQARDVSDHSFVRSHTFFSVIPVFRTASPERVSFWRNDLLDNCCNGSYGALEVVPFGGRSTNSSDLAKFFLPPTCSDGCCIRVSEFPGTGVFSVDGDRGNDVEARHFNIETNLGTFRSNFCIKPRHKFFGVGLAYKQRLCTKANGSTGLWAEISTPIMQVKNRVCVTEQILDDGGGALSAIGLDNSPRVGSMTEAFRQSNWRYGKIDNNRENSRAGLGDIELKFGFDTISTPHSLFNTWVGAIFPTGNRPKGEYVFEAVIGNNKHWGAMFGNAIWFDIWGGQCWILSSKIDINNRYLFSNHQTRSFDLIGKPWGRYMETYATRDDAAAADNLLTPPEERTNAGTSGINEFTRRVRVHPRFSTDITSALQLQYDTNCGSWLAEGGLNIFARQAEKVEIDCCCSKAGLKGVLGLGNTTFARTIRDNVPCADIIYPDYQQIKECDFDLESAAHPAVYTNTVYGSLGCKWCETCPTIAAIGGSYEISAVNTALNRWMIWGKFICTF